MLEIGSVIDGKYKILSRIGNGGMSVVYMAINEKANKTWAVKEVRKDGHLDFEAVKQGLIMETDMLKKLSHPHLPSIIDVIEDDETFIIVMDYIEGNSLKSALDEYGAQKQELVIEWAKQLCDVLGYLHSRKPPIIYRDMKPGNIMLKPDGNLVLIDFGIAREFKEMNLADTVCLGTIGYAAPEQFGGMGQTDARTDIYCLGATLYHLVTGCNPSELPYEIKPIREINPALSTGLEKIILKCVQKDPANRYQSAAELMYALEHYEQIDDIHKRKQKRKLRLFSFTVLLTLALVTSGFVTRHMASEKASDNYDVIMERAARTVDYNEKVQLYKEAIAVPGKGGDKEAYLGLIKTFKENDYEFTTKEQEQLIKQIEQHRDSLLSHSEEYVDVCFETGKLFWYYYSYGDSSDNQVTKMKSAIEWFDDVITHAPKGYANLNMANVYREIGMFYRDVAINTVEASDHGIYKAFFENIQKLSENILTNNQESEIVRLELCEMARSALQQYATKLKADGVLKADVLDVLEQIAQAIGGIDTTTDKTKEKKSTTINLMEDTRESIELAYGTGK